VVNSIGVLEPHSHFPVAQPLPQVDSVFEVANKSFNTFKKLWPYAEKVIGIAKDGLNIFLFTRMGTPNFEKIATYVLPLITILNTPKKYIKFPLKAEKLNGSAPKVPNAYRIGDIEGVALSSISLSLLAISTVEAFTAFGSALKTWVPFPNIDTLKVLTISTISSMAIFSLIKIYQLGRALHFRMSEEVLSNPETLSPLFLTAQVREFLDRHLDLSYDDLMNLKGDTPEERQLRASELLEKKEAILERKLNRPMLLQMIQIKAELDAGNASQERLEKLVENINQTIMTDTALRIISLASSALTVASIVLSVNSGLVIAPLIMGSISTLAGCITFIYENLIRDKELPLPEPRERQVDILNVA